MKLIASLLLSLVLTAAPVLHAQAFGHFAAYEHCHFPDGLTLVESNPLAAGIKGRTVKTVMGNRDLPISAGTRLLYGYPDTQPFASVKVEQIPTADYRQARLDLIANFEMILTGSDPVTRNDTLKPRLNGSEIYGLDRTKLEGAVVGIYLFFVDRTHTVVTVNFLNQSPDQRRFSSLEDYGPLRDSFLTAYTHCAPGGGSASAPAAAETALPSAPSPIASPKPTSEVPASASIPGAPLPDAPLPNAPQPNGAAAAANKPAPASTFVEPVAKPVTPKPAAKPATKANAKPAAKAASKTAAKPAPKTSAKPGSRITTKPSKTKPGKKPAAAKDAKIAKTTKPAHKSKDPDQD